MTQPQALVLMGDDAFANQFDDAAVARLRVTTALPDPVQVSALDDPALADRLREVELLVTGWGAPALTAERLERLPALRGVVHAAGSIRSIVSDVFWDRGILAANVADTNAVPVAQLAFAMIVLAGKKAPFLAQDLRAVRDDWAALPSHGRIGNVGRTIGLVGFSRIGRRVTELLQSLDDVTVLVADPFADTAAVRAAGAELVPLEVLLPRAEILSIHAPELPSTFRMIGAPQLAALPDGATVINTARGSLIDTAALEAACASGRIDAILDVTDPEPLPATSALYELPNVMLTPHIAGSLGTELAGMTRDALAEVERFAAGEPFLHPVTRETIATSA